MRRRALLFVTALTLVMVGFPAAAANAATLNGSIPARMICQIHSHLLKENGTYADRTTHRAWSRNIGSTPVAFTSRITLRPRSTDEFIEQSCVLEVGRGPILTPEQTAGLPRVAQARVDAGIAVQEATAYRSPDTGKVAAVSGIKMLRLIVPRIGRLRVEWIERLQAHNATVATMSECREFSARRRGSSISTASKSGSETCFATGL